MPTISKGRYGVRTIDGKDSPEFDGKEVKLGDYVFVIPSLSTKQARKLWPQILELDRGITAETMPDKYESMIQVIHAALTRNYPEVTVEQVEELVEVRNIRQLLLLVSGMSGIDPDRPLQPDAVMAEAMQKPKVVH